MDKKVFKKSGLPVRKTVDLLPEVFKSPANDKFLAATLDALVQPGSLERLTGYIGRTYGKTYNTNDVYLDVNKSLRYAYQLEPGVAVTENNRTSKFYDYIDFKNQQKFFGNKSERDDLITNQEHYSWAPPIDWDKFVNYRDYYWLPSGPDSVSIAGQGQEVVSSYRVRSDGENEWLFIPDGLTRNPPLTLYRGQTYEFNVNAPGNPFYIRTSNVLGTQSNYTKGVTNSGAEVGKIKFTVPNDAPDLLYYQSDSNFNRVGSFRISNITDNTFLDVDTDILGKINYKSTNGIEFTNGLKIEFLGKTTPEQYSSGSWIVEGVGTGIRLVKFSDLELPPISNPNQTVVFDDGGFDDLPFDDATSYPSTKDYITINRSSKDLNPWSRYNRWFHRSTIEYAASLNDTAPRFSESTRAKRPILEFNSGLQLFNHGIVAKNSVDLIDDFTTDVFSTIEGTAGYNIDNVDLFHGARVLFTADTDPLVKNKIYVVNFITVQTSSNITTRKQISLVEADDVNSEAGECLIVRQGKNNAGLMYHYNGSTWSKSQLKTKVNQPPLFDVFDSEGISVSDSGKYGTSSFIGSSIVGYKVGTGAVDSELGFAISYLNINNSGDILFEVTWETDTFTSQIGTDTTVNQLASNFYKINENLLNYQYGNGWIDFDTKYYQGIIQVQEITTQTSSVDFTACFWNQATQEEIYFYLNGKLIKDSWSSQLSLSRTFTFNRVFNPGDVLTIKVYTDAEPDEGFYEFPIGIERNPLNQDITEFSLGQANDHLGSMVDFSKDFVGEFPGASNLRDISGYQQFGKRFMKHSGVPSVALPLLSDKTFNVVKSLRFAAAEYEKFKSNLLSKAIELPFDNQNIVKLVDDILTKITEVKSKDSPFVDSDMIGSGAFKSINYVVEDEGITTFALSTKFDLTTKSTKAVYVYINGTQQLHAVDYVFDSTFGFVKILKQLNENDVIEIREYFSTAFSYIPETPTKLGLYKKYTPRIYIDDTYITPTKVIQGHDGSITVAFDDFRDDVLLEFERRVYNNIKQEYDSRIFDIDKNFGGYYGNAIFDKPTVDSIVIADFLRWSTTVTNDLYTNLYFDDENPFTYTYSRASDLNKTRQMPGHWRGLYSYLYDTTRPHVCPWEMLGFSEKPTWWEDEYGPAPYPSGNLLLWEDLRDGIIRQGPNQGVNPRYARPNLLSILPVDEKGNLKDPIQTGCIIDYTISKEPSPFLFGDMAPVEYAWRKSSSYPFSIMVASSLLRSMEFISNNFDRSIIGQNLLDQIVSVNTQQFINLDDIKYSINNSPIGLFSYIINYVRSNLVSTNSLHDFFDNFDIKLSSRIGGFVDKSQQKYLLDSKSPQSKTSGVFVPVEDYEIFFNVSSPSSVVTYSGVVIEKISTGYKIIGYDRLDASFQYYTYFSKFDDPTISIGGVSESYLDWLPEKFYSKGTIVKYNSKFFRTVQTHTSSANFDLKEFIEIQTLPLVGAVTAVRRTVFDKQQVLTLPYGSVFETVQSVVDFLLGYQEYLKDQGLVFDDFNNELLVSNDWETSAKEFMFWTTHNWSPGAIISLSPAALKIKITSVGSVADNLLDNFYDYSIYGNDGRKLGSDAVDVYRTYNELLIAPSDLSVGIYFAKINFVLKEHVVVFNDRTIFNDVIYDKGPGYRQERMKVLGFRTSDWDGDYTSPGFIFDVANIKPWEKFTDYRLGDIIQYKQFNYVSKFFQKGTGEFDRIGWEKLDSTPKTGLVANFDYKINQIEDFFEVDYQGINGEQKVMARHSIGYQTRSYLQDIAEDEVSQFKLYQGFIREKGTINAITKVFDKVSKIDSDAVDLKEEWAFLLGSVGGVDQYKEIEVLLKQNSLKLNPQPILLDDRRVSKSEYQNYILLNSNDYKVGNQDFKFPTAQYSVGNWTAGYVFEDDVDYVVRNISDIYQQDITLYKNGQTVWVTFTDTGWNVLRYRISNILVLAVAVVDPTSIVLETNRVHGLSVGTIIGLTNIKNLTGFYLIKAVGPTKIIVTIAGYKEEPEIDQSSFCNVAYFIPARIPNSNPLISDEYSALPLGTKLWMDTDADNNWNVIERRKQYSVTEISEYGVSFPTGTGAAVEYLETRNQTIVSNPGRSVAVGDASREAAVIVYAQGIDGLVPLQILNPQSGLEDTFLGSYGDVLRTSKDGRWLVVSSPNVSNVPSNYRETYSQTANYNEGDTVLYAGKLWTAIRPVYSDGSTADFDSSDWVPATTHKANPLGKNIFDINQGYRRQGAIEIYEYDQGQYVFRDTLISPRPAHGEQFGSSVAIGKREGIEGTSGDIVLTVNSIDTEGGITEVSVAGISGLADSVFSNISGVDVSTSGENATFDVNRFGGNYTVTVRSGGIRYVVGDRLKIIGSRIGGATPFNDLLITVTAVSLTGEIIGSETYTNISGINSLTPTVAAVFTVSKVRNIYSVTATNSGIGYIPRSIVRFSSRIYACIKDTGVDRGVWEASRTYYPGDIVKYPSASSTYYKVLSSIPEVYDETAGAAIKKVTGVEPPNLAYYELATTIFPTNTEYWEQVSGGIFPTVAVPWQEKNTSGTLVKYVAGSTIYISGDQVGGIIPDNDITIKVNQVNDFQAILNFSITGTASTGIIWDGEATIGETTYNDLTAEDVSDPGSGAIFNIVRTNGNYTAVVSVKGTRYTVGDQIKILGTSLGGVKEAYYMIVGAPGSRDDQGRAYLYTYEGFSWKHLEDTSFLGVFNLTENYTSGATVWHDTSYWKAVVNHVADGSTVPAAPAWEQIVAINTGILPKSSAFIDDGSTMESGIFEEPVEFLNIGDRFSSSIDTNQEGTVLVVSAPKADSSEFDSYKGVWKSYQDYFEGDTVKRNNSYYTCLVDSINNIPEVSSSIWELETNVDTSRTGSVFVYTKDENDVYHLIQTLDSNTITELSNTESGDQFGHKVLLTVDGLTLFVSAPNVDMSGADQGAVYVFRLNNNVFEFDQKIQSVVTDADEKFGSNISISPNNSTLAIGAEGGETFKSTTFDAGKTAFDRFITTFKDPIGKTGKVYIYTQYLNKYVLSEIFEDGLTNNEDFGRSISTSNNSIIVGSPQYLSEDPAFEQIRVGRIQKFTKQEGIDSWTAIRKQTNGVDISKIKNLSFYNGDTNVKIADIDVIDPFKDKILSVVEKDIDYKTSYDPSIYSIGADDSNTDEKQAWTENKVGTVWWNTSTAKWVFYEQGDTSFRLGNWSRLAFGSSIDVYEWVETTILPSRWVALSGTAQGTADGISGTPLHADDSYYSKKEFVDSITGKVNKTHYYYWVKDKTNLPINSSKTNPVSSIANFIRSPLSSGLPFAALLDENKIALYNAPYVIESDRFLMNIQFFNNDKNQNLIHNEYQLLAEGTTDLPNSEIEKKWIDSLVGEDILGNEVPDRKLTDKSKYGILSRPRQTMFVDRNKAVKISVDYINSVISKYPLADTISYDTLNSVDLPPAKVKNLYDATYATYEEILLINTFKTKTAVLKANIINGHINTVDVIEPGYGYKVAPPIKILGTGTGAELLAVIDTFGRVTSVTVVKSGKKYLTATLQVRPFSVLVESDSTVNGFWSIWSFNDRSLEFYRSATQSYDTTKFWSKTDWWETGFSEKSRIKYSLPGIYAEPEVELNVGELLRLEDYGAGGWAVLERVSTNATLLDKYRLVGRELGTINISDRFYNKKSDSYGYDLTQSFDSDKFDTSSALEFKNILKAVKEDIFVNNLNSEWNKLFFVNIHYVFSEQLYVNWAFKTSFMNAVHNVGYLSKKLNYKSDNLSSFQEYINEVKPYRTKIRKYTSKYLNLDNASLVTADFDLPPTYNVDTNTIDPVKLGSPLIDQYPWKNWFDNYKYSVTTITIVDSGIDYTTTPQVIFEGGGGAGAKAKAFISNGKVTAIQLVSGGYGYTSRPIVKLVGGVGSNIQNAATAVAYIGDSKARTFDLLVKFDRYSKTGKFKSFSKKEKFIETETFVSGRSTYDLKYPSTTDKSKISVVVGNDKLLSNEYTITLFTREVDGYTQLRGRLTLPAPASGVVIVSYEKNDQILDSLNRLDKYYTPKQGMLGFEKSEVLDENFNVVEIKNDYSQLMTGIDYGGVIVQGATFDVGAGWDALPWFTEGWDSSETLDSDFYIAADGSTHVFTLPEIPKDGVELNIYQRKKSTGKTIRLDPEQMPTFIGDGSTSIVTIPDEILVEDNDVFIFRKITSDGSLTIGGRNLLDANISGGSLSGMTAYSTALGTTAAEIVIDGDRFISPEQVPAPEENVPGQVLESVSIKVFHTDRNGSPAVLSRVYIANGTTSLYDIGQLIIEQASVSVYVDKILKTLGTDFIVEAATNQIRFIGSPPVANSIIEIFSISVGGIEILDVKEFLGDGETRYFLTGATFAETQSVFASIDGIPVVAGWVNSNGRVNSIDQTLIEFGAPPALNRKVVVIVLSEISQSLVRFNQQSFEVDSSVRTYPINSFVTFEQSATSGSIVELNGNTLTSVDTVYVVYFGESTIPIGLDPLRDFGSIIGSDIKVYINGSLKTFGVDYEFNGDENTVILNVENTGIVHGDIVVIEDYSSVNFKIENNNIIIDPSVTLADDDELVIFWTDQYPQTELLKDLHTGGKLSYSIQRPVLSISYVRVYKNGTRLTPDIDYYVSNGNTAVYITQETLETDIIEILSYSNAIYNPPVSWEIFKDVLNQNHFNRYSIKEMILAIELNYFDNTITLNDASTLPTPTFDKPGIISINGEKIQYFSKAGTVLSNIKRGLYGTSIATTHPVGSSIIDSSYTEYLPYKESQEKENFISSGTPDDSTIGSAQTIGPLIFIPLKSSRVWEQITKIISGIKDQNTITVSSNTSLAVGQYIRGTGISADTRIIAISGTTVTLSNNNITSVSGSGIFYTIPEDHGPCDQIEVFVGGRRLRKDPMYVYDSNVGSDSPQGDILLEAEFSVDGTTEYVRLTTVPEAGQRVTIIKRTGNTWYNLGAESVADGLGMSQSTTPIVKFLQQATTKLP